MKFDAEVQEGQSLILENDDLDWSISIRPLENDHDSGFSNLHEKSISTDEIKKKFFPNIDQLDWYEINRDDLFPRELQVKISDYKITLTTHNKNASRDDILEEFNKIFST